MKCKECGCELSNDVAFCGTCGKPTSPAGNKVKCKYCDVEISSSLEYCTNCGKPTSSTATDNNKWNKENKGNKRDRRNRGDDEDDDEGGILSGIGDLVGKLFG